jgi:uncharacterized membrane protein HdeD (DUF308 family)
MFHFSNCFSFHRSEIHKRKQYKEGIMTSAVSTYPPWVRGLDVITGLVAVVVGFWIFLDPALAALSILYLFSFSMLLIGFTRIVKVATTSDEDMKRFSRGFNATAGVIAIIAAVYVFMFPLLTILLSVAILAVALLVSGFARLLIGAIEDGLPIWARILLVIVGLLTIVISVFAILFPGYGFVVLVLFIAITLIINGFTRLISGITGRY